MFEFSLFVSALNKKGTRFAIVWRMEDLYMPVYGLFGKTVNVLSKNIDLRAKQQNLISSNIANAETPNYVPKALSFEGELQGAIKTMDSGERVLSAPNPRHFPLKGSANSLELVTGHVLATPSPTLSEDGNAVELESEMSKMVENQVMYNAAVQILSKKFEGLRNAIKGQ